MFHKRWRTMSSRHDRAHMAPPSSLPLLGQSDIFRRLLDFMQHIVDVDKDDKLESFSTDDRKQHVARQASVWRTGNHRKATEGPLERHSRMFCTISQGATEPTVALYPYI
jgi:predicted lipoprotein